MRAVKHKFVFSIFLVLFSSVTLHAAVFDFDGDGKTDPVVVRYDSSNTNILIWFILRSRDGFSANYWGVQATDGTKALGDYDGDGRWDLTVIRSNDQSFNWHILNSRDNTVTSVRFGISTDQVMPQDYDGDGKTDIAVYRGGGQWYVLNSRDGSLRAEKFGQSADTPYPGDYDGDGKADLTVRRNAIFYTLRSSDGNWQAYNSGNLLLGAYVVPGDYDGDGKTDYAFWRGQCDFGQGGVWTIIRSSDNHFEQRAFGLTCTDFPTQGDYDGDGKTDIAVWRQGNEVLNRPAYFYILQSRDGFRAVQWGSWTDDASGIFRQRAY
jgi:spore coat protein A, manganese oxidase